MVQQILWFYNTYLVTTLCCFTQIISWQINCIANNPYKRRAQISFLLSSFFQQVYFWREANLVHICRVCRLIIFHLLRNWNVCYGNIVKLNNIAAKQWMFVYSSTCSLLLLAIIIKTLGNTSNAQSFISSIVLGFVANFFRQSIFQFLFLSDVQI